MIVQRKILLLQEWRKTPTDSPTITVANVEKQNDRRSSERGLARSAGQQRQSSQVHTSSKRRQRWQDPGRGRRSLGDLRCRDPFGAGGGSKPHSRNRGCIHLVAPGFEGKGPPQMPKPVINEGKNRSNPRDVRGRFAPLFASWYFLGHGSFSGDAARGRSERPS